MAEPVLTRILETIKARLAAEYSAAGEVIVVRDGRPVVVNTATIVVQQLAVVPAPAHNRMGRPPAIGLAVPVHVHHFLQINAETEETEEEYSARCNLAASEIVELVTTPLTGSQIHWHTMDGNAMLTSIGPMKYLPTDAGVPPGISIPLLVTYRVSENDHTEARN